MSNQSCTIFLSVLEMGLKKLTDVHGETQSELIAIRSLSLIIPPIWKSIIIPQSHLFLPSLLLLISTVHDLNATLYLEHCLHLWCFSVNMAHFFIITFLSLTSFTLLFVPYHVYSFFKNQFSFSFILTTIFYLLPFIPKAQIKSQIYQHAV